MNSRVAAGSSSSRSESRLHSALVGREGLRSGWRALFFLLMVVAFAATTISLLRHFVPSVHGWMKAQPRDIATPPLLIFDRGFQTLWLFLAAFVMTKIEKRSFSAYGLRQVGLRRRVWLGSLVGFGAVLLQITLIAARGGYSLGALAIPGADALKYALLWALAFLLVAVSEEFLFRGYLQATLASGIGFWPAAVVLSIGFGAYHLGSPGRNWQGTLFVVCAGMFGALTLRLTGDLWLMIGFHAAWDWGHTFFFSVPVAGVRGTHQLLHSSLHGPQWLTGGSWGPDGSVFAFVVLLCLAVLVRRVCARRRDGFNLAAI